VFKSQALINGVIGMWPEAKKPVSDWGTWLPCG
jgi:hypothetical protein